MREAFVLALLSAGCGVLIGVDDMEYVPPKEPKTVALAALNSTTCAARDDGSVWCWGANDFGQLGTPLGQLENLGVPVRVALAEPADVVSVGTVHACAAKKGIPEVWCWGGNAMGQANPKAWAEPSTVEELKGRSAVPARIELPEPVEHVAAGFLHTCALTTAKNVYCWGSNHAGQCGGVDLGKLFTPVPVAGKCGWTLAAALVHLGDVLVLEPKKVASGVDQLVLQRHTTCTFTSGAVRCWGGNCGANGDDFEEYLGNDCSSGGQLGVEPQSLCYYDEPTVVNGVGTPRFLSLGHISGFVAVTGDKVGVLSWGWDGGQLGRGKPSESFSAPGLVLSEAGDLPAVKSIALTNGWHQIAQANSGDHYSWGRDDCGELGRGKDHVGVEAPYAARATAIPPGAEELVSGQDHFCYLLGGRVYCAGHGLYIGQPTTPGASDSSGEEGDCKDGYATPRPEPVEVRFE